MPPRARKTPAKKEAAVVTEANDATVVVTEETAETPAEQPVKRGRKRSELGHAARDFEKWTHVASVLEQRFQKVAEKLSEIGADLDKAVEARDAARTALDDALNGGEG